MDKCMCGNPIIQPVRGRRRKYCSDGCRRAADNAMHGHTVKAHRTRKTCKRTGCENRLKTGGRGRPSEYCSAVCKRARTPKSTRPMGSV